MYCCFTALLRVALADVAIFNLYYNTPGNGKRTRDELVDLRTTCTRCVMRKGRGHKWEKSKVDTTLGGCLLLPRVSHKKTRSYPHPNTHKEGKTTAYAK